MTGFKMTFNWLSIFVGLWYNLDSNLLSLGRILHPKISQFRMERDISLNILPELCL